VAFTVGSGSFHFTTSSSRRRRLVAASSSSSSSAAAAAGAEATAATISACDQPMECPLGKTIVRVLRAGFVQTEDTDSFLTDADATTTPLHKRYLVTHALEGLCHGSTGCVVVATAVQHAISPAVTLSDGELATPVCAALACK